MTLTYTSPAGPDVAVGTFDVANAGNVAATSSLPGTNGVTSTVQIEVTVDAAYEYDFRVFFAAKGALRVDAISSQPVA